MQDRDVLSEIQRLVDEEHQLREPSPDGEVTPEQRARLRALEISLDQCWDLLRQRRARREFGMDPDDAKVRNASTVKRFKQ